MLSFYQKTLACYRNNQLPVREGDKKEDGEARARGGCAFAKEMRCAFASPKEGCAFAKEDQKEDGERRGRCRLGSLSSLLSWAQPALARQSQSPLIRLADNSACKFGLKNQSERMCDQEVGAGVRC